LILFLFFWLKLLQLLKNVFLKEAKILMLLLCRESTHLVRPPKLRLLFSLDKQSGNQQQKVKAAIIEHLSTKQKKRKKEKKIAAAAALPTISRELEQRNSACKNKIYIKKVPHFFISRIAVFKEIKSNAATSIVAASLRLHIITFCRHCCKQQKRKQLTTN
jgi:hypothetical protein